MTNWRQLLFIIMFLILSACAGQEINTKEQTDIDTHLNLARGYMNVGRNTDAIQPLKYVIGLDSKNAMAWMLLGEVHRRSGDIQLAKAAYQESVYYDDAPAAVFNNYGTFLFQQKKYQRALEYFVKAGLDPSYHNRGLAYQNAGFSALKVGQKDQARQFFKRALQLEQGLVKPYFELAELAYDDKQYTLSNQYYQRYIKQSKHSAQSLWLGIRLARVFHNEENQTRYAMQLQAQYPETESLKHYQESLNRDR